MSNPPKHPDARRPTTDEPLSVIVEKQHAGETVDSIRREGVYDGDRSAHAMGQDGVAIPVTRPPETVDWIAVIRDSGAPDPPTLADELRTLGWTEAEVERAPSSWAVVGEVILVAVDDDTPRPRELAEALLAVQGGAHTVLARGGIAGEHRHPNVTVLAGDGRTQTVHTEAGTEYALDLSTVMFSPGNKAERIRMGDVVGTGETVLDMFAGIGYFALPMARGGATVTAVERNPTAFGYLLENVERNGVADRMLPHLADCRDVASALAGHQHFDRIVMGHYDAWEFLDVAVAVLASGGVIHVHEATPDVLVPDRPIDRLRQAVSAAGRSITTCTHRIVKSYSEGVSHVVVTATVQ